MSREHITQERESEAKSDGRTRAEKQGHVETGESQARAESAASGETGGGDAAEGATRGVSGLRWIERLTQDLRYGSRVLRRNPAYAFVSVLTLALGIGASTAIFSVIYGILLRPLPYYKPEQIVRVWEVSSKGQQMQFADPNFEDMRAETRLLQGMAEMRSSEVPVTAGDEPERARVAVVSKDFFSVMGVEPVVGRLFAPEEQQFGSTPAALVSYSYWQSRLHGARDLGSLKLTISNKPAVVVGVLPPGFNFPDGSQVWTAREAGARLPSRSAHNWQVVARLRDDASLEQVRSELSAIARRLSQQYTAEKITMVDSAVLQLRDALTGDVKPALLVLQGAAGLLLLVAFANVMNLSLSQTSARAGELAIRVALGASRGRLVRQFLAEALLPSLLGGCLGVIGAYFGVRALVALAPSNIPRLEEVSVNLPLLGFALALSLFVAAGLGILTALRATSGEVQSALGEGGRRHGAGVRSQRTSRLIVAGQIAITLTLLVGAGLLGRSMLRVLSVNPGFETEHVAAIDLKLSDSEAQAESRRVQFLDQLISRLQTLPDVQAVGGTNALPLASAQYAGGTFAVVNPQQLSPAQRELIERSASVSTKNPDPAFIGDLTKFMEELFRDQARTGYADYVVASGGYFRALGIPLRAGRLFNDADGPDAPHVAVISESVARQKWPDQDPIGHTIEFGNMDGDLRLLTVVGVVGEVRARGLDAAPRPAVYVNYRQRPRTASQFNVVLRTNTDPAAVFASVRRVMSELDPTIPPRLNTFTQIYSESLNSRRFNLLLVGAFALAALLLAMAGVFGVLAYSVAQRTREIGVRIALGASPGRILRMVLGQGLLTAGAGIVVGLLGSFLLTRTMSSLLFEVSPNDSATVVCVALLLILVAMLASYIPARRATRVDPMVALRHQ
jgi:ABC-type antimicrobial peptide transport system permease subunit